MFSSGDAIHTVANQNFNLCGQILFQNLSSSKKITPAYIQKMGIGHLVDATDLMYFLELH